MFTGSGLYTRREYHLDTAAWLRYGPADGAPASSPLACGAAAPLGSLAPGGGCLRCLDLDAEQRVDRVPDQRG